MQSFNLLFLLIFVKISDSEGTSEGAMNEGGPAREMFRLVLSYIQNSQLFVGTTKKLSSLNNSCLNDNFHCEAGRIIALSLIHGGSRTHWFSNTLFCIIASGTKNGQKTPKISQKIASISGLQLG